jgi:hypothetical protein
MLVDEDDPMDILRDDAPIDDQSSSLISKLKSVAKNEVNSPEILVRILSL